MSTEDRDVAAEFARVGAFPDFPRTEADLNRDVLEVVRAAIDDLDMRLAPMLAARADLVLQAAEAKEALGLPARDRDREEKVAMKFAPGLPREMARGMTRAAAAWQVRRRGDDRPPPTIAPGPHREEKIPTAYLAQWAFWFAAAVFLLASVFAGIACPGR